MAGYVCQIPAPMTNTTKRRRNEEKTECCLGKHRGWEPGHPHKYTALGTLNLGHCFGKRSDLALRPICLLHRLQTCLSIRGRGAARNFGPPPGILGRMKNNIYVHLYYLIISISFSIFWGPCQSGALRIILPFPPYTAPLIRGVYDNS